jgi:hypothetical protein
MDRRLLDYNPESETFEAGEITRDESEWRGATDTQAVFGEADEMELAAELLEVMSEAGLERFLGGLVDRAAQATGRVTPISVRGAVTSMLKAAARRTLPVIGRAVGEKAGGATGAAVGAQVVDAAARYFGLELEGLSPEDQEFEAARRFIRFAGEAAKNAVAAPTAMPPVAAMARAARRYAPGLPKQLLDPRPAEPGARRFPAAGGRWVRRGQNIVVNGF